MPENETDKLEQEAAVIDADANVDLKIDTDVGANANQADVDDDSKTDDSQKETSEKKPSIFDTIKNIIRRKPDDGTADADDSDGGGGTDGSASEGKDIPAQFTEAAIAAGMSAEQISEHASDYTDAQLLEQIPDLKPQVSENSDKSEQLSKKEAGDTKNKDDSKSTDDTKDEEIKLLKAENSAILERLDKVEKGQLQNSEKEVQNQFISRATSANKRMDELSKEFEIFGTYKTLPRFPHNNAIIPSSPQAKARNEVWGLAEDLHIKAGMDFNTALDISLDAFKGKHLSADVKRNLVKDLKRNEKQLSAKRSSHEAVKTDLSGPDLIREIGKKHGLEIR